MHNEHVWGNPVPSQRKKKNWGKAKKTFAINDIFEDEESPVKLQRKDPYPHKKKRLQEMTGCPLLPFPFSNSWALKKGESATTPQEVVSFYHPHAANKYKYLEGI